MILLVSSQGIRIIIELSRGSSKAGRMGRSKTNCTQFGETTFSCYFITCLITSSRFCVRAPRTGDRLLEVAAEEFFKEKSKTMGDSSYLISVLLDLC